MIKNFEEIPGVINFKRGPHKILIHTLEDFYGSKVRLLFKPIEICRDNWGINIELEPKREYYKIVKQTNSVLLVVYVEKCGVLYYLGIQLDSPIIQYMDSAVFHSACVNIGRRLTEAANGLFRTCHSFFNESLAKEFVVGDIGRGKYDLSKVSYLIDMFLGHRSTTFEGKNFSTGLIVTKSLFAFCKSEMFNKNGKFLRLVRNKMDVDIADRSKTRFWYLADGFKTFYLTDFKKTINSMFLYKGNGGDYVSEMLLKKTLQGADALFRVNNGRELSIINSDGYEYLHQENTWKFRNYDALKKCVLGRLPHVLNYYDDLIKYVLYCSKSDTSSIIWIPRDIITIDNYVIIETKNELTRSALDIKDPDNMPIIKRLLSSDGATVIDANGKIRYFGCIADLSKANVGGIKGTGETAASLLAQNGIAIKISQDGPIKIFIEGEDGYISF